MWFDFTILLQFRGGGGGNATHCLRTSFLFSCYYPKRWTHFFVTRLMWHAYLFPITVCIILANDSQVDKMVMTHYIDDIVILEYIIGPILQCRIWLQDDCVSWRQHAMVWQDKRSIISTKTLNSIAYTVRMFSAGDCNNEIVLSSSEATITHIWAGVVFVVVIKHIMFFM